MGRYPCGWASVDFSVGREVTRPATSYEPVPVDATTREIFSDGPVQLLISFAMAGQALELPTRERGSSEFPTPDLFEPPVTYPISA